MNEETKPTGPDFSSGIPSAAIPESGIRAGHAGDEPVILCRSAIGVYAVSATCPHYGGPLGEGAIVGNTVRCPWHHAAFDLRDGSVVSPPALNPLSCWRVETEGETIYVREKLSPPPPAREAAGPRSVVILGGGAAGHSAAETLRREGYASAITIVSADAHLPYDRPNLSKDYLAGNAPEEWIPLRPEEFYSENGIAVRLGTTVTAIDAAARRLRTAAGESIPFDRLLIATGAEALRPPIPGATLPHVHLLRTFDDSRGIIEAAAGAKRAVVIGASFIGLESAASLITRGVGVDVVAPEEVPLGKVFGPQLGGFVRALHEEKGVRFHLGTGVASIEPGRVILSDGVALQCDLVIMGTGVRPAARLAEEAGIRLDNGIVVDEFLETSAPGIYAAGDVARWKDARSGEQRRVEHWVVAQRQGQVAARNMLGRRERFESAPFFWSAHYDVVIAYVGYAPSWDSAEVIGDLAARDARVTYRSGGRAVAVATIFRDGESLGIEAAMERGDFEEIERLVSQ